MAALLLQESLPVFVALPLAAVVGSREASAENSINLLLVNTSNWCPGASNWVEKFPAFTSLSEIAIL